MEDERLIYLGRWSRGYILNDTFIKELNHYEPNSVEREMKASNAAFNAGILTPKCYNYSNDNNILRLYFQYIDMAPYKIIDPKQDISIIFDIIKKLRNIQWGKNDVYWYTNLIPDFSDALSYIGSEKDQIMTLITQLKPEIFIHGDMSCQNIGQTENGIYLYDFQHGCYGPYKWDLCYLAGTLSPYFCDSFNLSKYEQRIAFGVAAIRYGRAIRKSASNVDSRKKIFEEWRKMIE